MSSLFENNIELLKKSKPLIAEKVIRSQDSGRISVIRNRSGAPTLRVDAGKRKITLHSSVAPEKEAGKIVDASGFVSTANVIALGFGLGYSVKELLKRDGSRGFVLVVERDVEVFRNYLQLFDIRDIFGARNVFLLLDEPMTELFRFLQGFSFDILANGVRMVKLLSAMALHPGYYAQCIRTVGEAYNWSRVNTTTQIKKSEEFSDNITKNLPFRLRSPGIAALRDAFRGLPAVIVATGPSLRKNVHLLRYAKGRAVILALDSSLKLLLEEGIEPDLVFSIDFTDNTITDFEGVDSLGKAFLVVDPEVCPAVVRKYPGRLFFIDLPGKKLCEWFASISVDKGRIEKGLSVSHTAFATAIAMGLNPVILVGQDLSYPSEETHARGTSLGFPLKNTPRPGGKPVFVRDVFGGQVMTDKALLVFLHHYRDIISRNPQVQCIDATEGGAEIEGAKVMSLKEALLVHAKEAADFAGRINVIHEKAGSEISADIPGFVRRVRERTVSLTAFAERAEYYLGFCEDLGRSLNAEDYPRIQKLFSQMGPSSAFIRDYKDVIVLLEDNITEALVAQARRIEFDPGAGIVPENRKNLSEIIERDRSFYEKLSTAAQNMLKRLEDLIHTLENIPASQA